MPGKAGSVLFINHWAKNIGGAERSLLDILEYMAPRHRMYLITSEEGTLTDMARAMGVDCLVVPCNLRADGYQREHVLRTLLLSWTGWISFLRYVVAVSSIVNSIKPDCIHANVPKSHVTLFLLAGLGYRGKSRFHMRELFNRGSLPYILYSILFPYKRGRIIAISEAVKANLPIGLQKRTTVVYNGVLVPPQEHKPPGAPIKFLYLGRIVPWKGCHHLIEIFAWVHARYPASKATLTLIGDTSYWTTDYRTQLSSAINHSGLSASCFLLPHTDDTSEAFKEHDVFCNASRNEPFGRSIAEAQAAGLPVIAFEGGGVREIVEHEKTGIVLPYGDREAFAQAMKRMIDNSNIIVEMGLAGRKRATELFNREIQAPKIYSLIR